MTSVYPRLLQEVWLQRNSRSEVDSLRSVPQRRPESRKAVENKSSRMTLEEDAYERETNRIRSFGDHWLRPVGVFKTVGQVEDEEREVHESYEEYEDEDGELNQNNLEAADLGMDDIGAADDDEMQDDGHQQEGSDLDHDIEEGASFDIADSSMVSHSNETPVRHRDGLYVVVNGRSYVQQSDGSLIPVAPESINANQPGGAHIIRTVAGNEDALSSAESGSIGDYSDATEELE